MLHKLPGERSLVCPECGSPMKLRDSKYGLFYGCTSYPKCDGTHGAHPDGRPLGIPANKATKQARMEAHAAFDRLWKKNGPMSRSAAYAWMGKAMGVEEAHIGGFDREQCLRLEAAVREYLTKNPVRETARLPGESRKQFKLRMYQKQREEHQREERQRWKEAGEFVRPFMEEKRLAQLRLRAELPAAYVGTRTEFPWARTRLEAIKSKRH